MENCSNELKEKIINLLTDDEGKILELAQNRFGNYVLQKCLERIDLKYRGKVNRSIVLSFNLLNDYFFYKHSYLLEREKLLMKFRTNQLGQELWSV